MFFVVDSLSIDAEYFKYNKGLFFCFGLLFIVAPTFFFFGGGGGGSVLVLVKLGSTLSFFLVLQSS